MKRTGTRGSGRTSIWDASPTGGLQLADISTTALPLRPSPRGPALQKPRAAESEKGGDSRQPARLVIHRHNSIPLVGGRALCRVSMMEIQNQAGLNTWKLCVVIKIRQLLSLKRPGVSTPCLHREVRGFHGACWKAEATERHRLWPWGFGPVYYVGYHDAAQAGLGHYVDQQYRHVLYA